MTFFRRAGLVLPLLLLAACNDSLPIRCPEVGVIQDASKIVKFRDGPGHDPTDVVYEAEITKAHLDCRFEEDAITTDVVFQVTVHKGPAATTDKLLLPYFVAVVSTDDKKLVSKRQFDIEVPMNGQSAVILSQHVPGDASLVPRPDKLKQNVSSIGSGSMSVAMANTPGNALYVGQSSSSDKKPVRRPGIILPGVASSVPYQVLLGFQLDKDQLIFNRDAQTY